MSFSVMYGPVKQLLAGVISRYYSGCALEAFLGLSRSDFLKTFHRMMVDFAYHEQSNKVAPI
jgi:hypothetical protein